MNSRELVLQNVLALPVADRAWVAHALADHLVSVIDSPALAEGGADDEALLTELRRRSAAYRAGQTTARDASDVVADLRRRQREEHAV